MFTARILALTLLLTAPTWAAVSITSEGKSFRVQTPHYVATITADGCLTSLLVHDQQMIEADPKICRGIYLYDTKTMSMDTVEMVDGCTLKASSPKAILTYCFTDTKITFQMQNLTDQKMEFIVVFHPQVEAVRDVRGAFRKPPLNRSWPVSAWFRGAGRLVLTGSDSLWGPYAGSRQVSSTKLGPKQSAEVTLEAGMATPEEQAKATETANRKVEPPTDPVGPMWDLQRFSKVPQTWPAEGFEAEGMKALYCEGPAYEGIPTRVFAWLGIPKVEPGQKVPGMVLVHGGGGTAFANWVKLWMDRGYAAIAMDTCGALPRGTYGKWDRNPQGGPPGWGGYGQIDEQREDQWAFHAVASALLANTLLRAQPEVDPERIGVTGISWGGYLTSIIAGVDPRLKLAVPVYGCGFTLDHNFAASIMGLGKERADRWMKWWDPSSYLGDAKMPMLWVTGTNDFAYTFPALQKSYRLPKTPRTLAIRIRMPHGHGPAGEGPEEIRVFADSILKGGDPLPKITAQGREGQSVWATFESKRPVAKAELTYTKALGAWKERLWEALPAQIEGGKVTATLPEGTTVYYLNLFDDRNCVVSTEHEVLVKE
ncbi:MAG: acetylxylan esterase [Armatimonadia bacterium]